MLLLVFFSTPLSHLSDGIYSPADLGQIYAPLSIDPAYWPRNVLPFDVLEMIHPWLLYSREQMQRGQFPLWNPYNAGGVPLLANFQSGILSVYNAPFWVLPFSVAAIVSAFLKLFGLGLFTFLYLKLIGLGQVAALFGAVAFMFGGYNVLWLAWPNPGAVVALPGGLFFLERAFRSGERLTPFPFVGLSLVLAVGLLAGNPETFYFCVLPLAAYFVFRAWQTRRFFLIGLGCVLAGLIALGLAGAQLVPFFEYLNHGAALGRRAEAWQAALSTQFWPLTLYPDLLGSPANGATLNLLSLIDPVRANYNEVNSPFVGSLALLLAPAGLLWLRNMRRAGFYVFFGFMGLAWLTFAFNPLNWRAFLNLIPGMALAPYTRGVPIGLFALSVCAAFTLDQLVNSEPNRSYRKAAVLVLGGLIGLTLTALGAYEFVNQWSGPLIARLNLGAAPILRHADLLLQHLNLLTALAGLSILVVGWLVVTRPIRWRGRFGVAALLLVFIQSGGLLKEYNPTIAPGVFFPETPAIQQIKQIVGNEPVLITGTNLFAANLNLPYHFGLTSSYDAIDVKYSDDLSAALLDAPGPSHAVEHFTLRGLQLFGVQTLIANEQQVDPALVNDRNFEALAKAKYYTVYRFKKAVPRYHVVDQAVAAKSDAEALRLLQAPDFDPARSVVLSVPNVAIGPTGAKADPVILADDVTQLNLSVVLDRPGYLVLARTFYPGWKARVNGLEQPILRANYAFSALALPAGQNRIEFYYDPDSFRIGIGVSLISLLIAVGLIIIGSGAPARIIRLRKSR